MLGLLRQRKNKKTGRVEYALVSRKNPKKILKWFGTKRPTEEAVKKEERRVKGWEHMKKRGIAGGSRRRRRRPDYGLLVLGGLLLIVIGAGVTSGTGVPKR